MVITSTVLVGLITGTFVGWASMKYTKDEENYNFNPLESVMITGLSLIWCLIWMAATSQFISAFL